MILIEADLRRPSIGRTLGIEIQHDLMDVVLDEAPLEDALLQVEGYGPNFEVLLAQATPARAARRSPTACSCRRRRR